MHIPWATFVFRTVVLPLARVHKSYKDRLITLDRFFEKKSFKLNTLFGALLGGTIYVCSLPLQSFAVDKPLWKLWAEASRTDESRFLNHKEVKTEIAAIAKMKMMNEILSQIYSILDEEDGRRQLSEAVK
ncbi:hypothetical protein XU18_5192 [Perkinsela sp. CCAP 1560/4]|nr:hypothetical protein XU18_5192 [Perkinsela sp. CCAP 1560/4]|eukprot:KNH01403.1 hypothetical protein XU18_5192 [Perkinsela sp. CCAP 1560/4]